MIVQYNFTHHLCHSIHLRLIDLENSCQRTDDGELFNCQCFDAQRRVDNGQIDCGIDLCPDDCEVCKFCLYYVLECNLHNPSPSPSVSPSEEPLQL